MLESRYGNGYAGAMGWAANGGSSAALSRSTGSELVDAKTAVKPFADAKGYTPTY